MALIVKYHLTSPLTSYAQVYPLLDGVKKYKSFVNLSFSAVTLSGKMKSSGNASVSIVIVFSVSP